MAGRPHIGSNDGLSVAHAYELGSTSRLAAIG